MSKQTAKDLRFDCPAEIIKLTEGELNQKLAEMGCVPGTEIEKLYSAPSGDPIAFRIDSYVLGLRSSEAEQIVVKTNDELETSI